MEANRDAALLCRDRAIKHFQEGKKAEALRFAKKAKNLFPEIDIPGKLSFRGHLKNRLYFS